MRANAPTRDGVAGNLKLRNYPGSLMSPHPSPSTRAVSRAILPHYPSVQAGAGAHFSTPRPSASNRPIVVSHRHHILVVDDDPDLLDYLALVLVEAGYSVTTACNARIAIGVCQEAVPALVLSNVDMPEMDGLSLVHALRAEPQLVRIPILLFSAISTAAIRQAALAAGADDYLDKSIETRVLLSRTPRALRSDNPAPLPRAEGSRTALSASGP